MSNLSEDAARILGLIEGSELNPDSKEGKILSKLARLVYDLATELNTLRKDHEELDDYVESIDNDLSDLEEAFFEEQEDEDEDEDSEEEDEDRTVEYSCPHCGSTMSFSIDEFDFDEDYLCPTCHKPLFPETPEDEDEDDDEDEDEDN